MESIIARAMEYTLKYWLKSFSRDQFKLYGLTAQLSNLDINGDALHSIMGLPPALNITAAKVGKLEIMLPSVSNVQWEPIVVQIDRLDLVLEENQGLSSQQNLSTQSSTSSAKGGGYGFADKIADGMTLQVGTVNLLIETCGAQGQGGATWASPLASITMRNLLLYTTNENWQVVNLKEARDFSNGKNFIYVFKKLEWESLSVDLLLHPDMFMNADAAWSEDGKNRRGDDGAKRVFFGGERFLEGISGEAYRSTEAAGHSLVSVLVDHIFLCIKDAGKNFSPPIYPLGGQQWQLNKGVPLICFHSLQFKPSAAPPMLAAQTVIESQPLIKLNGEIHNGTRKYFVCTGRGKDIEEA
ncbi:Vacuolar protein sorting-associated protein 13-like, N-terminal domain [Dillenia turbinata]|uniref:Vacuolar protein sorting-associated protein 13-like, N-terminal domain n=1 Tax=Dillenia turbinata TaxID=194707 RepID=A0AAN8VRI4_9MAGN